MNVVITVNEPERDNDQHFVQVEVNGEVVSENGCGTADTHPLVAALIGLGISVWDVEEGGRKVLVDESRRHGLTFDRRFTSGGPWPPYKDVSAFEDELRASDVEELDLDELVEESFSEQATQVNNEGMTSQIRFLFDEGWSEDDIRARLSIEEGE